jgi:peroxiredoxin Q/BCP
VAAAASAALAKPKANRRPLRKTVQAQPGYRLRPPPFSTLDGQESIMATMPAFSLPGSDGKTWTNADLKGKRYVLYFYPKDSTSGCTTEACDFRDAAKEIAAAGLTVLGVSPDSLKSHANFITKQQLNFVLLADTEKTLSQALGVWVEKSMYGRKYMGIERSTFLVDAKGTIIKEWRKVKVNGHVAEVLAAAKG